MDLKWTKSKKAPVCDNCGKRPSNVRIDIGEDIRAHLCQDCIEDWIFQLFYAKQAEQAVCQAAIDVLHTKLTE